MLDFSCGGAAEESSTHCQVLPQIISTYYHVTFVTKKGLSNVENPFNTLEYLVYICTIAINEGLNVVYV